MIGIQKNELSLLPRPVKLYSEIVDSAERLVEAFAEIRILRFSVPRKATVLDVLPLRREFVSHFSALYEAIAESAQVSAILINLWACGQAFRSRSPLPQCLPLPRLALSELTNAVDEHARRVRAHRQSQEEPREDIHQAELAILYGMAENEALAEVCNILDEVSFDV